MALVTVASAPRQQLADGPSRELPQSLRTSFRFATPGTGRPDHRTRGVARTANPNRLLPLARWALSTTDSNFALAGPSPAGHLRVQSTPSWSSHLVWMPVPATTVDYPASTKVVGLVSAAHFYSHFYLLLLPPLFPVLVVV